MGKYLDIASKVYYDINDINDKSLPRMDSFSTPMAAKIYSRILQDHVWVAIDTTFQADDKVPVYLPEEIRNFRGASPEDIQAIHRVKRKLGGKLVSVTY